VRPRRHKGYVLKPGVDGLISIFRSTGEPLAAAVKFVELETAYACLTEKPFKLLDGKFVASRGNTAEPRAPVRLSPPEADMEIEILRGGSIVGGVSRSAF